jgi:hypothetical protein
MIGGGGGRPKDMVLRTVEVVAGGRASLTIDATPGPGKLAGPPPSLRRRRASRSWCPRRGRSVRENPGGSRATLVVIGPPP